MAIQPYLNYEPNRRVSFLSNAAFTRDDYDWWVKNTGQPSTLFLNNQVQSQELGSYDIGLLSAWQLQPNANGVKVGVIDMTTHMDWVTGFIIKTAPGVTVLQRSIVRYHPDFIAGEIRYCVDNGCQIVAVAWGTAEPNANLKSACAYLKSKNAMLVCSLINTPVDVNTSPDFPASWESENSAILPVTSSSRDGQLYNWAGWGANCVAAPGRNVIFNGQYSSGTSYAAGIVAGVAALSLAKNPIYAAIKHVSLIRETAIPISKTGLIDPTGLLQVKVKRH